MKVTAPLCADGPLIDGPNQRRRRTDGGVVCSGNCIAPPLLHLSRGNDALIR